MAILPGLSALTPRFAKINASIPPGPPPVPDFGGAGTPTQPATLPAPGTGGTPGFGTGLDAMGITPFGGGFGPAFGVGGPERRGVPAFAQGFGAEATPQPGAALGSGATPATAIGGNAWGGGANTGFQNLDRWNDAITKAQQQVQAELGIAVPMGVIKSIMQIESNGEMLGANQDGAVGLMQLTPMSWGSYDRARLASDPAYNIYAGTKDLAYRYLDSPGRSWDQAAVGFFSGHYVPTGASDRFNSDYNYLKMFQDNIARFGSGGATADVGGGQMGSIETIWGGGGGNVSQEFGMTGFAQSNPSWYEYSRAYDPQGRFIGHTGLDVGMNIGSNLYSPVAGTVICQGTAGGPGDGSSGCGQFSSTVCTGPCGRFALRLDNGDVLVLGHMSNIAVRHGQRLEAGAFVGHSGDENGGHVHVEYRKKTPGQTQSGYTIVDPRTALAGGTAITGGGGGIGHTPAPATGTGYARSLSELWGLV